MKYIIYTRKSTDTEDKQVLSLDAQLRTLREIAEKQNLHVVTEYTESQSALKPGRPVFAQMIKDIQRGKADGILVWKIDRLARNMEDGGVVMNLLTTGIIKEIKTPEKTHYSSENILFMSVMFGMANQYSRDLSQNVKRGNKEKLLQGNWPNKAPLGYINDRNTRTLALDPTRVHFIKKIFSMYASGRYSTRDISDILFDEGLISKQGKKVSASMIHIILRKTFYYGIMEFAGEFYKGNHKPIISQKLFEQCQEVLNGYNKPRAYKETKKVFPFRGIFFCELCGCMITAERQKGIDYYHCTNGRRVCDQKKNFIRGDKLEETVIEELKKVYFDDELIEMIYQASLEKFHNEIQNNERNKDTVRAELEALKAKESVLTDKLIEGVISNDMYSEKSKELKLAILKKEQQMEKSNISYEKELATFELTKEAFKSFNFNDISFSEFNTEKKQEIMQNLLSNSTLKKENGVKSIILQYKKPYDIIANASYMTSCTELLPD